MNSTVSELATLVLGSPAFSRGPACGSVRALSMAGAHNEDDTSRRLLMQFCLRPE